MGNPDGAVVTNNNTISFIATGAPFHPMKGPMVSHTFRGMANHGPMHWRGDRTGASTGDSLELSAFKDFNVAFPGLVGRDTEISDADMQKFAEFSLALTYPPNPIRALNNELSSTELAGKNIFTDDPNTGADPINMIPATLTCNLCHKHDPVNGNFGTAGLSTVEGPHVSQEMKVPHLRNMYQKVGKFGNSGTFSTDATAYGDQIKGFGFMHDGGMDTLDKFLQGVVFKFDASDPSLNDIKRGRVVEFMMVMDSEMAPIVGQQITLTASNAAMVNARINLLRTQAMVVSPRAECDLIVKGVIGGINRGYLMQSDGTYQSDLVSETLTDVALRNLAAGGQTLTFTCVPPGSGNWMGIDHDEDGTYDRDEIDAGTDPLAV